MNKMPQQPGYYWAKWKIASDGTFEGDELTPSSEWEIVQVNTNIIGWEDETDEENPERLSVSVPGVREVQWRDGFVWGSFVAALKAPPPAEILVGDGEASIIECLAAGKPFVFDPATNFLHADDGTVEGGIRYMPVPTHHTGRLLPCPFCGGEPEFQESNPYDQSDDVAFTVFCRECGTEHPWRSTPEDAVAFWNRRAALSAEVEG